ncbi:hypothetical protein [Pelagerythrobacter sp.]|uniref:hypothetical protein n=1 Tax=Pelagerythrobacter sp. TaxID=2800702 RepID=UPI0035B21BE0
MSRYAAKTEVTSEKSRAEIERTLTRYGADGFMYGWQGDRAMIAFRMNARQIKFVLPMPDRQADEFTSYMRGSVQYEREENAAHKLWEQACRQRWRALSLVVKAKLEAVECGISEFDDEFMANIVMPDGSTIGQWARPQIADMYGSGQMPPLLPGPGDEA